MPLLLALLVGCVREADSIDEGCADELVGADLLEGESAAFLAHANCYRGYLGLRPLPVTAAVQASVTGHRDVLAGRETLGTRGDLLLEDDEEDGFRGETPFDRQVRAGVLTVNEPAGAAAVFGWFVFDAAAPLDDQIGHPMLRDALFQPAVEGAGYATARIAGAERAYLELFATLPSGVRQGRPVVYPKDGQTGVPLSWSDPWASGGDPFARETYGYPITLTVSGPTISANEGNIFGVRVDEASLTDDTGRPIPFDVVLPTGDRVSTHTTVALVPLTPLPPETVVQVDVELSARDTGWSVHTRFTTRAADLADTDPPDETDAPTDSDSGAQPTQR